MTDFEKYAIRERNINSLTLAQYSSAMASVSPTVIEERRTNAVGMDVFSRLLEDRIIFLGEVIDNEVSNIVQAQFLYLSSQDDEADISLYLHTPGGSVYAGLGIFDTMQLVKPDIATICTGCAASMGAVLLCAGAPGKRYALKHSRIMIHQPLGGVSGQASDIAIEAREIERCRTELYQIISEHTGQPFDKVFADADRNYWMSASNAVEYGMIDTIL